MAQTSWGGLIAWYLFLAGTGAGVYLIGSLTSLINKSQSNRLERIGAFWGPSLVALGSLLLVFDLGQPERFLYAIMRPFSSMISIGFIILSLFILVGFYHMFLLGKDRNVHVSGSLKLIGSLLAFGTAIYTGLLLGVVKAIPFWNNPLLPVLFLISALSAGAGLSLIAIVSFYKERGNSTSTTSQAISAVAKLDITLLIVELVMLFSLLFIAIQSDSASSTGAMILISGRFALIFWFLVVAVGIVLPLSLELSLEWKKRENLLPVVNPSSAQLETAATLEPTSNKIYIFTGACLLVGGLFLRYAILAAGVRVPLGF